MKKLALLFSLFIIFSVTMEAQFVKNWEVSATKHWLDATSNSNNSVAYNPVTTNLLASVRGIKVYVLNSQTGALVDSMSEGTITESFRYSKLRVTSDGVVYSCNLATGAGLWYIFRWANQADPNPTKLSFVVSARTGDAFEVVGTGTSTKIYASGSGSTKVYVFTTTDGSTFTMSDSITVVAGLARGGIGTEAGKDFIWVNGAGTALTKVGLNGTVLATPLSTSFAFGYPNDSVHTAYHTSTYFEHNGGKFVAITGRNSASYGKVFALYDVTNSETTPTLYGFDTLGNVSNTNGNATGDISVKKNSDGSVTLFHVVTNNGIASWTTNLAPLPVELSSFNASVSGTNVTLNWKTATEKNANQFVIEKNTNSVWTEIGYVKAVGTSTKEQSYSFTDKNFAEGNISYRLKIVDFDGSYEYSNVIEVDVERVIDYSLAQNYPNPFNPTTTIDFQIPSNGFVTLKVYDLLGKEVATLVNEAKTSGKHSVEFNASELSSGIYLYELRSGSFLSTKKLVLMK